MNQGPLPFWSIGAAEMLRQLQTAQEGLTNDEAQQRLARYGSNLLRPRTRSDVLPLLLAQFRSPIILVNGLGAVATGLATGVLAVTKFTHGAWVVAHVIPGLILWFRTVHGHYGGTEEQLSLARYHRPLVPKHNTVVLPISHVNRAMIPVLEYARSIGSDIRAVSVDLEPEETTEMKTQWEVWGGGVPLVILPSPYRSFLAPCLAYIGMLREKDPDGWVTVLLPEVIPARWWKTLLHNQRALIIRAALLFTPGVIVTAVPYHLER